MQFTEKEKRKLGVTAAIMVAAVGIPVGATNYSNTLLQSKQAEVSNLQRELSDLEERIAGVDEERRLLQANRQDYLDWVDRGVVGQQNPVKWVQLMKEIQRSRNLFETNYQFSEPMAVTPDNSPLTEGTGVSIVFWRMSIVMPMLHDLDIFMFLDDMQERSDSFFFPTECTFKKAVEDFELLRQPNMEAACDINWVSVVDPERKVGADIEAAAERDARS